MKITAEIYVEREEGELEINLIGNFDPGQEEKHTLSNGDPGYPGIPPSMELLEAEIASGPRKGEDFMDHLTKEELSLAEDTLWKMLPDPDYFCFEK